MLPANGILPIIHKIHPLRKAAYGQNALLILFPVL